MILMLQINKHLYIPKFCLILFLTFVVFICICFWLLWFLSVSVPDFCGFYLYLFLTCGFYLYLFLTCGFHLYMFLTFVVFICICSCFAVFEFYFIFLYLVLTSSWNFIFNAIKLLEILFVSSFINQFLKKFFIISVRPKQDIQVGKRKFKQWWSTIKPISTKPTICFTSTQSYFLIFLSVAFNTE